MHAFVKWCKEFGLELNVNKCNVMTFTRSRNPITYDYFIDTTILKKVDKIIDLGVIFSSNLSFNDDICVRISKARSMLGFIKRQCKDFNDDSIVKTLYISLVRPGLEYCSQVWNPNYMEYVA